MRTVENISCAIFVVLLLIGWVGSFVYEAREYRRRRRTLAKRPSLPFADIYNQCFSSLPYSRDTVERVWDELSSDLRVDPDKLRPADRFDKELSARVRHLAGCDEDYRLEDRLYALDKADVIGLDTITYATVQEYVEVSCRLESLASKKSRNNRPAVRQ
jgi:hypothetical protein